MYNSKSCYKIDEMWWLYWSHLNLSCIFMTHALCSRILYDVISTVLSCFFNILQLIDCMFFKHKLLLWFSCDIHLSTLCPENYFFFMMLKRKNHFRTVFWYYYCYQVSEWILTSIPAFMYICIWRTAFFYSMLPLFVIFWCPSNLDESSCLFLVRHFVEYNHST